MQLSPAGPESIQRSIGGTMQQITEVQQKNTNKLPQQSLETINKLFRILQGLYGNKWTSQHPTSELLKMAAAAWSRALAGMTEGQIAQGLRKLETSFPPSAPEFAALCRNSDWQHSGEAYRVYRPDRMLENKPDPETVERAIEAARRALVSEVE